MTMAGQATKGMLSSGVFLLFFMLSLDFANGKFF